MSSHIRKLGKAKAKAAAEQARAEAAIELLVYRELVGRQPDALIEAVRAELVGADWMRDPVALAACIKAGVAKFLAADTEQPK